jgi:hypothetical protein
VSVSFKVDGFRDIERALAQLPRGTAKGVARRAMKKELQPIANVANALWPSRTRTAPFKITSRIDRGQLRDSYVKFGRSVVNMFVGAPGGKKGTPHAQLIEFGTGPRTTKAGAFRGSVSPQPMLQPAWDMHRKGLLPGLGKRLWDEIAKTQARRAAKAAKG